MSFDKNYEKRMKTILGDEFREFEDAIASDKITALRSNPLKKNNRPPDLPFNFLDDTIPWEKNGRIYSDINPGKHPYHEAGVYYIQEPSAMAPVNYLDPKPGDKILDLCAAPGGKTTQIAGKMSGEGILITNEIDKKRAQILSLNVERLGLKNTVVTNMAPEKMADVFEGYFDKILVDAPCSGEGMFRKNEDAENHWSLENIKICAQRQKQILNEAVKMLAPGGRLVYSTCTFAPEEDEESVLYLINKLGMIPLKAVPIGGMVNGDYSFVDKLLSENVFYTADRKTNTADGINIDENMTLYCGDIEFASDASDFDKENVRKCSLRLWPHKVKGEGHFLAILEKPGDISLNKGLYSANGRIRVASDKNIKLFKEFEKETFKTTDLFKGNIFEFGQQLYLSPEGMPGLNGLTVLRPGLHLGTLKKDRFEPSHALALCLSAEDCNYTYDLRSDDPFCMQFIGGQSLRVSGLDKGWVLITVDGYSLGWAKYAGGTLKNHYPKGLRRYT